MNDAVATRTNDIATATDVTWLLSQLEQEVETTVASIRRAALIYRRLRELGVTVELSLAFPARYLDRIAGGSMLAELFAALQGRATLLNRASMLPLPDQERIARNEPLKVMQLDGDHRMVPPLSMTVDDIAQVFGNGFLRNDTEQIGYLRSKRDRSIVRASVKATPQVIIDRKNGVAVKDGVAWTADELARALAELGKPRR